MQTSVTKPITMLQLLLTIALVAGALAWTLPDLRVKGTPLVLSGSENRLSLNSESARNIAFRPVFRERGHLVASADGCLLLAADDGGVYGIETDAALSAGERVDAEGRLAILDEPGPCGETVRLVHATLRRVRATDL